MTTAVPADRDAQVSEVYNAIERISSLAQEGNAEGLSALLAEIKSMISAIKGTGSKGTRETLTKALEDAQAAAEKANEAPKEPTARELEIDAVRVAIEKVAEAAGKGERHAEELEAAKKTVAELIAAIKGPGSKAIKESLAEKAVHAEQKAKADLVTANAALATTDYTTDPKLVELRDTVAKLAQEGMVAQGKTSVIARQIADAQFEARIRITDKNGDPDWDGKTPPAKQMTKDALALAGEGMEATEENKNNLRLFWYSIGNQRQNAAAAALKKLDEDLTDEYRAIWHRALEAYPELKPSEAINRYYGVPVLTRSQANSASASLVAGLDAGASVVDIENPTPAYRRTTSHLEKAAEAFGAVSKDEEKLTPEEKKAAAAKFDAIVARAAAMSARLKGQSA